MSTKPSMIELLHRELGAEVVAVYKPVRLLQPRDRYKDGNRTCIVVEVREGCRPETIHVHTADLSGKKRPVACYDTRFTITVEIVE